MMNRRERRERRKKARRVRSRGKMLKRRSLRIMKLEMGF